MEIQVIAESKKIYIRPVRYDHSEVQAAELIGATIEWFAKSTGEWIPLGDPMSTYTNFTDYYSTHLRAVIPAGE